MSRLKHYSKWYLLFAPLKSYIRSVWQLFLVVIVGNLLKKDLSFSKDARFYFYCLLAAVGIFLLFFIYHLLCYFTQTYELTAESFIFRKGIFKKQELIIPYERIQTIKQQQWIVMIPLGLVRLMIETAASSGNEAEIDLPFVPQSLYEELENYRKQGYGKSLSGTHSSKKALYSLSARELLIFALTELSLFTPIIFMFALLEVIPEPLQEQLFGQVSELIWMITVLLFVLLYVLFAILSIGKTILQYANFSIYQENNDALRIEHGLIEQKSQVIPANKIQGIRIKQGIISHMLGLASVDLLLAGGQEKQADEKSAQTNQPYLLPLISIAKLQQYLSQFVPEYAAEFDLQSVKEQRLWYFMRFKLFAVVLPVGLYLIFDFAWWWLLLSIAILLALSMIYASFQSKLQAYGISSKLLCFQQIHLGECQKVMVQRKNIQSLEIRTSRWLYPKKFAHCKISVKAGNGDFSSQLSYLPLEVIDEISSFYRLKGKERVIFDDSTNC